MDQKMVRAFASAAALLLAVGLTGCGSDSSAGGSKADCTSDAKGSPIVIGNVGSYSGAYAAGGANAEQIIKAWACSVNQAGGISGHPVKLIVKDDAGNPATSLTAVKSLITNDHVVAIVGQMSTGASAWASYASEKGVPVVGGQNTDLTVLSDPNFYSAGGNIVSMTYGQVLAAKKNGSKVAVLYCAELAACGSIVDLVNGIGQPNGVSVAYSAGVSASAPDFTAQCLAIKKSGAQSYMLALLPAVALRAHEQCQKLGVTAQLVQSNQADSTMPGNTSLDGVSFTDTLAPFWADDSNGLKAFHVAIKKYASNVGSADLPLTTYGIQAWAGGKLFESAVKAAPADDITSETVKDGLYKLKDETLDGLIGPVTFTPGKPSLAYCYSTYELQGDDFTGSSGSVACADGAASAALSGIVNFITSQ